nr:MAG TPA: Protein of unknown function (DUF722) [Caudoviricetes sp.]
MTAREYPEEEKRELSENEKKKKFLWSYQNQKHKAVRLEEQLKELKENKISIHVVGDGMPHGNVKSDLSEYASKKDEIEREIVKERYACVKQFVLVRSAVEALEKEKEKTILTYRYLRGFDWDEIACKTGYCLQWVHKLHARGLGHFKIPKEAIESDT